MNYFNNLLMLFSWLTNAFLSFQSRYTLSYCLLTVFEHTLVIVKGFWEKITFPYFCHLRGILYPGPWSQDSVCVLSMISMLLSRYSICDLFVYSICNLYVYSKCDLYVYSICDLYVHSYVVLICMTSFMEFCHSSLKSLIISKRHL